MKGQAWEGRPWVRSQPALVVPSYSLCKLRTWRPKICKQELKHHSDLPLGMFACKNSLTSSWKTECSPPGCSHHTTHRWGSGPGSWPCHRLAVQPPTLWLQASGRAGWTRRVRNLEGQRFLSTEVALQASWALKAPDVFAGTHGSWSQGWASVQGSSGHPGWERARPGRLLRGVGEAGRLRRAGGQAWGWGPLDPVPSAGSLMPLHLDGAGASCRPALRSPPCAPPPPRMDPSTSRRREVTSQPRLCPLAGCPCLGPACVSC